MVFKATIFEVIIIASFSVLVTRLVLPLLLSKWAPEKVQDENDAIQILFRSLHELQDENKKMEENFVRLKREYEVQTKRAFELIPLVSKLERELDHGQEEVSTLLEEVVTCEQKLHHFESLSDKQNGKIVELENDVNEISEIVSISSTLQKETERLQRKVDSCGEKLQQCQSLKHAQDENILRMENDLKVIPEMKMLITDMETEVSRAEKQAQTYQDVFSQLRSWNHLQNDKIFKLEANLNLKNKSLTEVISVVQVLLKEGKLDVQSDQLASKLVVTLALHGNAPEYSVLLNKQHGEEFYRNVVTRIYQGVKENVNTVFEVMFNSSYCFSWNKMAVVLAGEMVKHGHSHEPEFLFVLLVKDACPSPFDSKQLNVFKPAADQIIKNWARDIQSGDHKKIYNFGDNNVYNAKVLLATINETVSKAFQVREDFEAVARFIYGINNLHVSVDAWHHLVKILKSRDLMYSTEMFSLTYLVKAKVERDNNLIISRDGLHQSYMILSNATPTQFRDIFKDNACTIKSESNLELFCLQNYASSGSAFRKEQSSSVSVTANRWSVGTTGPHKKWRLQVVPTDIGSPVKFQIQCADDHENLSGTGRYLNVYHDETLAEPLLTILDSMEESNENDLPVNWNEWTLDPFPLIMKTEETLMFKICTRDKNDVQVCLFETERPTSKKQKKVTVREPDKEKEEGFYWLIDCHNGT